MINAKKGTLCRWWLEEGGRKKHVFQTITGRSPPKIKTERKKEKKNKELSSPSRRGLYPPRNVKASVVPNLGFPSPARLQGGRGCAGRRGSGIGDTSIANSFGVDVCLPPQAPSSQAHNHPTRNPALCAEPPRVHLRSGQFGNSLGGPGGARRGVFRRWQGSPSRGGGRSRGDPLSPPPAKPPTSVPAE